MNITQYAESLVTPLPHEMLTLDNYEIHANFSGGKDSVALVLLLIHGYKIPKDKITLVHMRVDGDPSKPAYFDWPQTDKYLQYCANKLGLKLVIINSDKGLKERIEERGQWPSSKTQYCTSYLKRDVYSKWVRSLGPGKYLCCTGERAEESPGRAKKGTFEIYKPAQALTKNRIVHWYRPVHHLKIDEVWKLMELAGIDPHPCYKYVSRCSCRFCIFLSKDEMRKVAELYPKEFGDLVSLEEQMGHTMKTKKVKGETIPVTLNEFIDRANGKKEILDLVFDLLPCSSM